MIDAISEGGHGPSSVTNMSMYSDGVRSKRSSSGSHGSSGASLITSQATKTGTPASLAAFAMPAVPILLTREPSRKTVSAPTRTRLTVPAACSASESSISSTVRPALRRSSASSRPSPTGSETVQTTRSGGVNAPERARDRAHGRARLDHPPADLERVLAEIDRLADSFNGLLREPARAVTIVLGDPLDPFRQLCVHACLPRAQDLFPGPA